jgi:hypothetical protein
MTALNRGVAAARICRTMAMVGIACCALFSGCASQPKEISPELSDRLVSLRDQLISGKANVQRAGNAAQDLINQPRTDLTAQIGTLNTAVNDLNATRAQARATGANFNAAAQEYFAQWDEMMSGMSSDTQEAGGKRIALAKDQVDRLNAQAASVRRDLDPFMGDINEASTYLAKDSTRGGLQVVQPKLQSAVNRQPAIESGIDKMISMIDDIRAAR